MARGVTAQTNHSAAGEKTTLKRRVRGKIPLKPKAGVTVVFPTERQRATGGQSLAASVNTFSTVPRVIRTRIERATEPRRARKVKKVVDKSSTDQGNQPLARSSSGKVALGPWTGSAHLDLEGGPMTETEQEARKQVANVGAGKKSGHIVCQAAMQPPASAEDHKVHSLEMSLLQAKPFARDNMKGAHHYKRGHVSNRVGMINQPRRS